MSETHASPVTLFPGLDFGSCRSPKARRRAPARHGMIVAVGSTSEAKLAAAARAWSRYPELWASHGSLQVVPFDVSSSAAGAQPQARPIAANPIAMMEIVRGAKVRANAAARRAMDQFGRCDFAVGIEGGMEVYDVEANSRMLYVNISAAAVVSAGVTYLGFSPGFVLPSRAVAGIQAGRELGKMPELFGPTGKARQGVVGPLTGGRINRDDFDELAVLMALCPIVSPEPYKLAP